MEPVVTAAIISSLVNAGTGVYSAQQQAKAGKQTQDLQYQMFKENLAWQERMSSTAHQREVADLIAAGLNPILSSKYGGSSTPSGSVPHVSNPKEGYAQNMMNSARMVADTMLQYANIRNVKAQARISEAEASVKEAEAKYIQEEGKPALIDRMQRTWWMRALMQIKNQVVDPLSVFNSAYQGVKDLGSGLGYIPQAFKKKIDMKGESQRLYNQYKYKQRMKQRSKKK